MRPSKVSVVITAAEDRPLVVEKITDISPLDFEKLITQESAVGSNSPKPRVLV